MAMDNFHWNNVKSQFTLIERQDGKFLSYQMTIFFLRKNINEVLLLFHFKDKETEVFEKEATFPRSQHE